MNRARTSTGSPATRSCSTWLAKHWSSNVMRMPARTADEILGWTGTYTDLPVGLSWSGDELFVTERSGRTHRVHVPG